MESDSEAKADALQPLCGEDEERCLRGAAQGKGQRAWKDREDGETRRDQKSLKLEAALTTERHEWGWGQGRGISQGQRERVKRCAGGGGQRQGQTLQKAPRFSLQLPPFPCRDFCPFKGPQLFYVAAFQGGCQSNSGLEGAEVLGPAQGLSSLSRP